MNREYKWVTLLLLLFVLIRLPGIHLPYHQDETKTALISGLGAVASSNFYHPPLTQLLYRAENVLLGEEYFRLYTLIFGVLGALLATVVVRRRMGWDAALWTLFFLVTGAYSVHASLMLDTDGAILPLFFLISAYFYDRMCEASGSRKLHMLLLLCLSLLIGLLIKLSFIIVIGAVILDFVYREWQSGRLTKRMITLASLCLIATPIVFGLALLAIKAIYPVFSIEGMISHVRVFINFSSRGWSQIMIQAVKAVFYLSPVLILLPLLITKKTFDKTRVFFMYLALGSIFYFVLFDFSQGALDKYLMFSVVPLSVIAGAVAVSVFREWGSSRRGAGIAIGVGASALLVALALIPHQVFPLYPKTLWMENVFGLNWDMLFPFTGGSGPLGFYMSFFMIAMAFIISVAITIAALWRRTFRHSALVALLIIGLTYNVIFIEEFIFGRLYGSAPKVLAESLRAIETSPDITKVFTYNDIGGYELHKMNKFGSRFYAVPGNEEGHKAKFAAFNGHYLIIDIPKINPKSFYAEYFAKCESVFQTHDGSITGNIYKCSNN